MPSMHINAIVYTTSGQLLSVSPDGLVTAVRERNPAEYRPANRVDQFRLFPDSRIDANLLERDSVK